MKQKDNGFINLSGVIRIIAITFGVLILVALIFIVSRTTVLAKQAFRDAKNVYLALSSAEIEYYSQGKSIYDPSKFDGLSDGVAEMVKQLADNEGTYRIVSYDSKKHQIREMIYTNGNYYVTFKLDNDSREWRVKYLIPIYRYVD